MDILTGVATTLSEGFDDLVGVLADIEDQLDKIETHLNDIDDDLDNGDFDTEDIRTLSSAVEMLTDTLRNSNLCEPDYKPTDELI